MKRFSMLTFTLLCMLWSDLLLAQTGKLLGRVVERESGDAIKGASVVIGGTVLVAVTDIKGDYVITGIAPGEYRVAAVSISHGTLTISNVRVKSNITTTQDFQLKKDFTPEPVPYDQAPEPTKQVMPKYPDLATKAGIEGNVWTKVWIDEKGDVVKATVMKSDGDIFNQPAIDAAMQWKFRPGIKDGKPISVWVAIPFRFKLAGKEAPAKKVERLIIRVSSEDPQEQLAFEGSYLFKTEDTQLQTVRQKTPFVAEAATDMVSAIFHKTAGQADLKVKLSVVIAGKEHSTVSAQGIIVILGTTTLKGKTSYYAQPF